MTWICLVLCPGITVSSSILAVVFYGCCSIWLDDVSSILAVVFVVILQSDGLMFLMAFSLRFLSQSFDRKLSTLFASLMWSGSLFQDSITLELKKFFLRSRWALVLLRLSPSAESLVSQFLSWGMSVNHVPYLGQHCPFFAVSCMSEWDRDWLFFFLRSPFRVLSVASHSFGSGAQTLVWQPFSVHSFGTLLALYVPSSPRWPGLDSILQMRANISFVKAYPGFAVSVMECSGDLRENSSRCLCCFCTLSWWFQRWCCGDSHIPLWVGFT